MNTATTSIKTIIRRLGDSDMDLVIQSIVANNELDLAYTLLLYDYMICTKSLSHIQRIKLLGFIAKVSHPNLDVYTKEQLILIAQKLDNQEELNLLLFALRRIKDVRLVYYFAKNVPHFNASIIQKTFFYALNYCDDKDLSDYFCFYFAKNVENANILRLQNKVIANKNINNIFNFALYVKGVDITEIENFIINSNNPTYIFLFAYHIDGANIEKLQNAIIETKNAKYMCWFALLLNKSNTKVLKEAIYLTNDKKWKLIFKFLYIFRFKKFQYLVFRKTSINNKDYQTFIY